MVYNSISTKHSDKFKKVINSLDARVSFYSLNKFERIISIHRDSLPKQHKNIMYKTSCKDCDVTYVGQTSRQLKTRIFEYRNHINRNTNS